MYAVCVTPKMIIHYSSLVKTPDDDEEDVCEERQQRKKAIIKPLLNNVNNVEGNKQKLGDVRPALI